MLESFYDDIGASGQRVVATLSQTKEIQHYVLDTKEEIIPFLTRFEDYNTYHSLGAYRGLKPGPIHTVADLQGCTGVRAFAFDIDVGDKPEKYDTLEDAFEAVSNAVNAGHLPPPRWVIASGGGLQIYLVLGGDDYEHGLPEALWTSFFQRLRRHLTDGGLKIDPTVGSHPYRLLRSPCTENFKYKTPVWPEILNDEPGPLLGREWLEALPEVPESRASSLPRLKGDTPAEIPVGLKRVLRACKAMAHEYETAGAETPEPRWCAVANICAHTVEFEKGFHVLSRGHPEYTKGEARAKFNHIVENSSEGPWGCANFGNPRDPTSPCHGCWAAKMKLKNPISAARQYNSRPVPRVDELPKPERKPRPSVQDTLSSLVSSAKAYEPEDDEFAGFAAIEDHLLPSGVTWDADGFYRKGKLAFEPIYVQTYQEDPVRKTTSVRVSKDRVRWEGLTAAELATPAQAGRRLLEYGFNVPDSKAAASYIIANAFQGTPSLETGSFGWLGDYDSFYAPNGCLGNSEAGASPDLMRLQDKWEGQKGTHSGWVEAVRFYGRSGQEPYLMALLASLSSPLLSYFGLEKGVIFSLTGAPGAGKTTALKVASSVWGQPLSTISSMSSTSVATRIYLGLCGNLPMIFDEITQMDGAELKQLALEISQGLGRERGKKDGGLQSSETWQLNMLTTSNASLHQKLAEYVDMGTADMNRVIEVPIVRSVNVSPAQGDDILRGIEENHGMIGTALIAEMMRRDPITERKAFRKSYDALKRVDGLLGSDRFAASLIMCCYWAHKTIKRIYPAFPGDATEMLTWMRRQLRANNRLIESVLKIRLPTPDDFLNNYAAQGLIVQPVTDKGYLMGGQSLQGYLYDAGEWVIVPRITLETWCTRQALKLSTVLDAWAKQNRLQKMNRGPTPRWIGKIPGGILIDGKLSRPSVVMVHKGAYDESVETESGGATVTDIGLSLTTSRSRVVGQ